MFGLAFGLTVLILNVLACVAGLCLGSVFGYSVEGGLLAILVTVLSVSVALIAFLVWRMIRRSKRAQKDSKKG